MSKFLWVHFKFPPVGGDTNRGSLPAGEAGPPWAVSSPPKNSTAMRKSDNYRVEIKIMSKLLAEFIGTYALVFFGTGAIIVNQEVNGVVTNVGIAIIFGLIVMAMIYTLGNVSGAHINPAVSIAFTVAGRFPVKQLFPYICCQVAGGVLASLTLKFLFPLNEYLGGTLPGNSNTQSFVLELILTFFLMLVIIKVATGSKEQGMFAGLTIGAVVALEAMFAGPVCGASMNPARSIAPAIVSGHLKQLWIYIFAPVIGAAMSVPVSNIVTVKSG